ncbi:MAG TPA: IclR family transcriptional regulator [Micromonosporaceae bacterium]|nr:IclR family transcriptional regulator [Micromonosporaceae bacterium]
MAGNSSDAGRSVTNKVIAILLVFTRGNRYSLSEIARLTGLPISTTHRLATELAACGILERSEDGSYLPGAHLKMIGGQSMPGLSTLHEKARWVMEDLAAATARATVRFGVLSNLRIAFIERPPGTRPVSTFYEASTCPAHATAIGKALLAFSPPETVDLVIDRGLEQYTPHTLTTPERLRRALAVTRLTHVAIARGELEPMTASIAVPVFGAGGEAVGALELQAQDPMELPRLQAPLVVAARSLSRELAAANGRGHLMLNGKRRFGAPGGCHVNAMPESRPAAG